MEVKFDAAVFLTCSDWHTEPRSNRYHYATRFAKHLQVIFVQPYLNKANFKYEETGIDNITILHLWAIYGNEQDILLNKALEQRNITKPLLWIYNFRFASYLYQSIELLKVYHATEDYFCAELSKQLSEHDKNLLKITLECCDLVIAVSEEVRKSYIEKGEYTGNLITVSNGCDYKFWQAKSNELEIITQGNKKTVFYQGGINYRLNFLAIQDIIRRMPDWTFWFCGKIQIDELDKWNTLFHEKNVKYFGELSMDEVRNLTYQSTVGIIPYNEESELIKISFPLKAFEYVACGLPVVSVPIKALESFPEVFSFAQSTDQFVKTIKDISITRYDSEMIRKRLNEAKKQDYDEKFEFVWSTIQSISIFNLERLLKLLKLLNQKYNQLQQSKAMLIGRELGKYPFLMKILSKGFTFLVKIYRFFKRLRFL